MAGHETLLTMVYKKSTKTSFLFIYISEQLGVNGYYFAAVSLFWTYILGFPASLSIFFFPWHQ